jgi:acetyl-CoA C-acetyltransferase
VIVATARSPIGRAVKGSLKDMRPDDLAVQMVQAALARVPELDPAEIDDLMLGVGQPAGESGNNLGRAVAVLAGLDHLPGVTVNRYCSSSLQTTRMALHAIKAGEGDVFISAGVETVSRYFKGNADGLPDTQNPLVDEAQARTDKFPGGGQTWVDPRTEDLLPDLYITMGQTAENVAQSKGVTRADQDAFGVRNQRLAEKAIADGFWARDITPVTLPDSAKQLGLTPLARIVSTGVSGLSPEIMGLGPVDASRRALALAGLTIDDIDLVEINEAFAAQVIPSARDLGIPEDKLNVNGGAIEMATLGDPLADLAVMLVYHRLGEAAGGSLVTDASTAPGFLSETEVIERYAAGSDRDLSRFGFYLGLAAFKLAAILEGIHYRHLQGQTVGGGFDNIGEAIHPLLAAGLNALKEHS